MSGKNILFSNWLLYGGSALYNVSNLRGRSIVKDSVTSLIRGLGFKVDSVMVVNEQGQKIPLLRLAIHGWKYSINNDSHEYPILSFNFREREGFLGQRCLLLSDVQIFSTEKNDSVRQAELVFKAAVFLVKQIEDGRVPDENTVFDAFNLTSLVKNPAFYQNSGRVQSDWHEDL